MSGIGKKSAEKIVLGLKDIFESNDFELSAGEGGPDADTIDASGTPMLGICVLAASAGAATTVLRYGSVRADASFPTFTAGQLFVSQIAGHITNTAPTSTDTVRRVIGHAITGDAMFFNPSPDYITNV